MESALKTDKLSHVVDMPQKKKKLNLYRLPPKVFEDKEDVIYFSNLSKVYSLAGRDD